MSRPLFQQARKTTLYSPITSSETGEIVLKSLVDLAGNQLDMTDFGDVGYITLNPGGDQAEIISFTDFTVNDDDTVSLDTGIVRGLLGVSPYGAGGTAYDHAAGTIVIISNNPQIYDAIIAYLDGLVIAGASDMSLTAKGIGEEATTAEIEAGTQQGSTGAELVVNPKYLKDSIYKTLLPSVAEKAAMAGTGTPSGDNKFVTADTLDVSIFGDGSDGDVTISSPTTITRDMYYNNLVLTDTLTTNGFRVFVKGTVSGAGKIANNGSAGGNGTTGGAGGAGGTAHTGYFINVAGVAAPNCVNNSNAIAGNDGTSPTDALHIAVAGNGGKGGRGDSGAGAAPNGGTGGTGVITTQVIGKLALNTIHLIRLSNGTNVTYKIGGSGGSGGTGGDTNFGSTTSGSGGGGGASGGLVFLCAKIWSGTFTIEAKGGGGGNGGNASGDAAGGGGGGGGSGGFALTIYKTKTWTGSYVLTGGAGGERGLKSGTGMEDATAGTAGNTGSYLEVLGNNLI
jgi:hypothetical protein